MKPKIYACLKFQFEHCNTCKDIYLDIDKGYRCRWHDLPVPNMYTHVCDEWQADLNTYTHYSLPPNDPRFKRSERVQKAEADGQLTLF